MAPAIDVDSSRPELPVGTEARRLAIQTDRGSIRALAGRHGVNPKTVAKWRHREDCADRRHRRGHRRSTILRPEEESNIVRFRCSTALPLDDCYYALSRSLPHLSRSALYRCMLRHGVARQEDLPIGRLLAPLAPEARFGMIGSYAAIVRTQQGSVGVISTVDHGSKLVLIHAYPAIDDAGVRDHYRRVGRIMPFPIHSVILHGPELIARSGLICGMMQPADGCHLFEEFMDHDIEDHVIAGEDFGKNVRQPGPLKYRDLKDVHSILESFIASFALSRKMKSLGGRTPAQVIEDSFGIAPASLSARIALERQ